MSREPRKEPHSPETYDELTRRDDDDSDDTE